MKKIFILLIGLLFVSCSTVPKIEVNNPYSDLLPKAQMMELIKKRYFSYIHCRNAEVELLEINPIINKDGKKIIPVVANTKFQEIKGMGGWLNSQVKALYHFYKNDEDQWKVKRIKEFYK